MIPAPSAKRVSSATVRICSFRIRLSRWVSTVRWLMPSSAAISLFVLPRATPSSTSRSRAGELGQCPGWRLVLAPERLP